MSRKINRRELLKKSAFAGAGLWVAGGTGCSLLQPRPRRISPNEKMNIACIGVGGRGRSNVRGVRNENIVALCDVDDKQAGNVFGNYPKAKRYKDFRKMLEEVKEIDAVTVSTPDHQHAFAAMMAMQMGKHVYCEKPLTHDVYEARMLTEAAKKYKVVTQMGNQGSCLSGLREAVEVVRSGAIGPVREVHVWTNRPIWPQGIGRPKDTPAVPKTLDWDLWLGTAPERPYHPAYLPFNWRGWWDYGTGALGDMACHTANMAFMACKLGYPTSVEAEMSEYNPETFPVWSVIRYEFPARGDLPPLKWVWYDGGKNKPGWVNKKLKELAHGNKLTGSGSLIMGDKGTLYSPNDYGAQYKLLPEKDFEGYKPPTPWLPRLPEPKEKRSWDRNHHDEWIRACKEYKPDLPMSNFSYAGPLTETVVLGCVAMRAQQKIEWDGPKMRITNLPEANQYLRRNYRKGWKL
ncbi:MAG: Gfo/Idh/MocA family oxidoreductase [Planctomycetota bacterium]